MNFQINYIFYFTFKIHLLLLRVRHSFYRNSSSGNETVNRSDTWRRETELDTEEAFLSRPKLPRTPP